MILVVGSTGVLGLEIVRQLCADKRPVRALVRSTSDPEKIERLKSWGATIMVGNLIDKPSLATACQGITTVITTATTTTSRTPGDTIPKVDQLGTLHLVEAAMEAGASQFIYVSTRTNIPDCALSTAKRTVEERLMGSGMAYTILRSSVFMEIWLSPALGFNYPNSEARIYGRGENPISWISVADVARFTVMAVDQPAARNTILDLGGPENLSPNQVVKLFEATTGKSFHVDYIPVEALQMQRATTTDPLLHTFASLMLAYANGDSVEMQATLQQFPVKLTSIKDYATQIAAPPTMEETIDE